MQAAGLEVRTSSRCASTTPLTLLRWAANLQAHWAEAIAAAGYERERAWKPYMLAFTQTFDTDEITVYPALATRLVVPHRLPLQRVRLLSR